MQHDRKLASAVTPMFSDFLEWAKAIGEHRDTIYEIVKVGARLDLTEEELDQIPADLKYFEKVVALSPYGAVSRSKNLDTARKRGNSRVRSALQRFLAARGHETSDATVRVSYDRAIDFIVDNEGFLERGALFTTSTHRPFLLVRARARVDLPDLDQAEFDRLWHDATPDGRKSLRKFAGRVAELRRGHNRLPELADLLPRQDFIVPVASDRARRIEWKSLPADFRVDAEEVFRQTLRLPSDMRIWAREQMRQGRSAVEIDAEIATRVGKKKRLPKNTESALAGYARRPKSAATNTPPVEKAVAAAWPEAWLLMKPGLDAAGIKNSTRKRYLASIDRCATVVAENLASAQFGFIAACDLSEAFLFHPDEARRVKSVTAANYIEGLIALGTGGGVAEASLTAMRVIQRDLRDEAALAEKNKYERLSRLMERGGFAYVANRIGELRTRAHALPAHSAARRRNLQQAVVCAVILNKPPRKGDAIVWRLGEQLVREADGTWRAEWEQEKTGGATESGAIQPDICEILDEWILGGRPDRLVHHRYHELIGLNWLTLEQDAPYRNLPTELTKAAIGVPSQDLRTLAADYMRRHDPAHAADVIATHLGHRTREAGKSYRAECTGAAAEAVWQDARKIIAARSAGPSGKRGRSGRAAS